MAGRRVTRRHRLDLDAAAPAAGKVPSPLRAAAPLLAAPFLAWLGGLGPLASAALLGGAAWLALLLARRQMPVAFAALALFGGVVFGFMAAVFAALHGVSAHELLALEFGRQPVGITLAWIAIALATLGVCSGTTALLRPPPDDGAG